MHFCLKNLYFVLQKLSKMGTLQRDTGSDTMKHNPNSVYELSEQQLDDLHRIIECTGRPTHATFYAVSGDDVYAVFELKTATPCTQNRFLYVKALYGPEDGSTHFVSAYGFFANQFLASQFLCAQAAQEERGYMG